MRIDEFDIYKIFYKTFLQEMPQILPGVNDFATQLEVLRENIQCNNNVTEVINSVFKLEDININRITYWIGDHTATNVAMICDCDIIARFCKVTLTSKNLAIRGKPYASDLYLTIKEDLKQQQLVFTSDKILSNDGVRLWQGLVKRGNSISVYDTEQQKYVLNIVKNEAELLNYLGDDGKHRYVFVLSESFAAAQGQRTSFALMEIKRKANWPLFDHYMGNKL